jgi:SAM-dependent methyltransferase
LQRGFRIEAFDLSRLLLDRLIAYCGTDVPRPLIHAGDIAEPPSVLQGSFDAVIGFFTLHHLHDLDSCFAGMRRVLVPGGRLAFVEPNALNPLFYVQILVTPGMTWKGDGGVVRMRRKAVFDALAASGFQGLRLERFGFFPPFAVETELGRSIELKLERLRPFRPFLPFQLFAGEAP